MDLFIGFQYELDGEKPPIDLSSHIRHMPAEGTRRTFPSRGQWSLFPMMLESQTYRVCTSLLTVRKC